VVLVGGGPLGYRQRRYSLGFSVGVPVWRARFGAFLPAAGQKAERPLCVDLPLERLGPAVGWPVPAVRTARGAVYPSEAAMAMEESGRVDADYSENSRRKELNANTRYAEASASVIFFVP
jgi:hypothetical protein